MYCRLTGNYPETGLEEINRDLPEEDFWGVGGFTCPVSTLSDSLEMKAD